jgi:hypothetical protein
MKEVAGERSSGLKPWGKGQSGNPLGRPAGTKYAIEGVFLKDLHRKWQEDGASIMDRAEEQDPIGFMRIMAQVLPKQIAVNVETRSGPFDAVKRMKLRRLLDMLDGCVANGADLDDVLGWIETDLRSRLSRHVTVIERGTEIDG